MALLPVSPRHARMLLALITSLHHLLAKKKKSTSALVNPGRVLAFGIAVAAAMSLENPFLREAGGEDAGGDGEKRGQGGGEEGGEARLGSRNGSSFGGAVSRKDGDGKAVEKGGGEGVEKSAEEGGENDIQEGDNHTDETKAKKAARNKAARAAQARFRVRTSDSLSVAFALQAYDAALSKERFCAETFLHAKTMHEMSELRSQLARLVAQFCNGTKHVEGLDLGSPGVLEAVAQSQSEWFSLKGGGTHPTNRPSQSSGHTKSGVSQKSAISSSSVHETDSQASLSLSLNVTEQALIQQSVLCGWADRVARKLSPSEASDTAHGETKRPKRLVPYQPCTLDTLVYLHPSSSLYREAPPYVVYSELVETSHPYMRGSTRVAPEWLPMYATALCTFPKPRVDPPPFYDSASDTVQFWVEPIFGQHLWTLPLHSTKMESEDKMTTSVFASALLHGKVIPSFAALKPYLAANPNTCVRAEGQSQRRVVELLFALEERRVHSRRRLEEVWEKEDPAFLQREIGMWVQASKQGEFVPMWVKLQEQNGQRLSKPR
eukprot:TRINITY_DN39178_c0_g1_i1.p1 TRINITY_DN39178_c0_g1~~TRINITY_DN39178_c0_g1_i1.p1  ORF type:complete len:643 (+),score=92.70 TRINITY_DN39178_c0_g1_i1:286-1929(+)